MRWYFLAFVILGCLLPAAEAQTLGEVLRATQNRKRLLQDAQPLGISLIEWGHGLSQQPSDAQAEGLPVDAQIDVLRKAWHEVEDMSNSFIDTRNFSGGSGRKASVVFDRHRPTFSPETAPDLLRILARRLQRLHTIDWWNVELKSPEEYNLRHEEDDLGSLPTSFPFVAFNRIGLPIYGNKYEVYDEETGDYIGDRYRYSYSELAGPESYRLKGSKVFPGKVIVYHGDEDPHYLSSHRIQGLDSFHLPGVSETLYDPAFLKFHEVEISQNGSVDYEPPQIAGSITGEWTGENQDEDFELDIVGQPALILADGRFDDVALPGLLFLFTADFDHEFTFQGKEPPSTPRVLELRQNLKERELSVVLDDGPGTCQIVWSFAYIWDPDDFDSESSMRRSLSARNALIAVGSGEWDAVYSGLPADREPEVQWGDTGEAQAGRRDFHYYTYEWWRPVLTQLVTPTTGVNITQEGATRYRIDFYRRDQVGSKSTATGRYGFTGQPYASWTVENPSGYDNLHSVRISTGDGAVYNLDRTETHDGPLENTTTDIDSTTYHLIGSGGGTTFLDTTVAVNGIFFIYPLEVVENTSLDGVALPQVQTNFTSYPFLAPFIQKITESGSEGTRTTTYSYAQSQRKSAMTGITQGGGPNPFTVANSASELPTAIQAGASSVSLAYNGNRITQSEKLGGTTVRTLTTTYTGGFRVAETEASNAPGMTTALLERYPGTDPIHPWGVKAERGFDGSLTTYAYSWQGDVFVTETRSGRGTSSSATAVVAGTRILTKVNQAGMVISQEVFDIESGARLDFAVATQFQSGTPFPSAVSRPLGTTETFTWDGQGRVLSHTDRLSVTTTYQRDAIGRITQVARSGLTWAIEHNPGFLGRRVTCGSRVWTEQTSAFGGNTSLTIAGPEQISVTRAESASTITLSTSNATTNRSITATTNKGTLQTTVSGNAVALAGGDSWTTTFAPGSQTWTTANSASSALTRSVTLNGAGFPVTTTEPSAAGSGSATTTLSYTDGLLTSMTDPDGATQLAYRPDGALKKLTRGDRFLAMDRVESTASQITWRWSNAAGEKLWERTLRPATGVVEETPWGQAARKVTASPSVAGDVYSVAVTGANLSASSSWKDGSPSAGTFQAGAQVRNWTTQSNAFGEVTQLAQTAGGGTQTWQFNSLGLPTALSGLAGLGNTTFSPSFSGGNFTLSASQGGQTTSQTWSPAGLLMAEAADGAPDQFWSAPSLGGTISRTLTTAAGPATFQWTAAGTLKQRAFPDGSSEQFSYSAGGRLESWTKAGGSSLAFSPNAFGEPSRIGSVVPSITYDNAGRIRSTSDAGGAHTRTYTNGRLDTENHTGGPLASQSVDRDYDAQGRLSAIKLSGGAQITYAYGGNGVLQSVKTASGQTGTWSNFDPVTGQAKSFSSGPLTTSTTIDALGRLTAQSSTTASGALAYSYGFDAAGNCTSRSTPEGGWTLGYNGYGYLASASRSGQSFGYSFDEAGRPTGATDYRPTARANSAMVEVFGSVNRNPLAVVTVNSSTIPVDPLTGKFGQTYSPGQGWHTFTIRGTLAGLGANGSDAIAEEVREVYLPPPSESLSYQGAGNRSADARWNFAWNDLDQLTSAVESSPPSGRNAMRLDFLYDGMGRRIEKKVLIGNDVQSRTTFLYDGWKLVRETEYSPSGYQVAQLTYTWGPDVSGSLDGAAGIGGLLEILEKRGGSTKVSLPVYDGQGNITALVDGGSGIVVARFEYGPFGELIASTGSRAASCLLRWQTKYWDEETGLIYFGKRYFDPKTQSWLSRDPVREAGGVNLYAYCNNRPFDFVDPIGLDGYSLGELRALRERNLVRAIDNGNPEEIAAAQAAMSIFPDDSMLAPRTGTQRFLMGVVASMAPGPSETDLALSPAQPTGTGVKHQVSLHHWSVMNTMAGLISVGNDPSRLVTGGQSISAEIISREYVSRFSYGERSMADTNVLLASIFGPTAVKGGVGLAQEGFGALRGVRWTAGGAWNPINYRLATGELYSGVPRLVYRGGVSQPEAVINALSNFRSRRFFINGNNLLLDRAGMTHILERHHPLFWNGTTKASQSFFPKNMSIAEIENAIAEILKQNPTRIGEIGANGIGSMTGNVNGIRYQIGINRGRVGQFFPLPQ